MRGQQPTLLICYCGQFPIVAVEALQKHWPLCAEVVTSVEKAKSIFRRHRLITAVIMVRDGKHERWDPVMEFFFKNGTPLALILEEHAHQKDLWGRTLCSLLVLVNST